MSQDVNKFRSDKTVEDQLIEKIEELEKRIESMEKANKAFRDNVNFDIENITRRINSQPVKTKTNWDELRKQARQMETPYYLRTTTI